MSRILVIEDEPRISSFLSKGLTAHGFATELAGDAATGLGLARTKAYDLVVLDLGLPDRDGLDVLRELRRLDAGVPVIILTAREGVAHTVAGFDSGADDYVTKPFSFEELLARIRARLRATPDADPNALVVDDAALDLRTRRLRVGDRTVELSAREFALAEAFFRHPDQVLSREQLLDLVWGYDYDPGSNVVEVYIGYLRKKIGKDRIVSVRGMGYRLVRTGARQ